jgi:integrase
MKLTRSALKTLSLPEGVKERIFFDDDVPGFGLRLREGGSLRFIVQYDVGSTTRRITIGSPHLIDLGKARDTARDILASVRLGGDPSQDKHKARRAAAETLGAVLPRYLAFKRGAVRASSHRELERYLTVHARPLHPLPLTAIDRRSVASLIGELTESSGASAADKCRASLSAFFAWAMREGLLEQNPAALVNRPTVKDARDRVLTDAELRLIWQHAGEGCYGSVVMLLLLTGCRREEIGGLRWSEVHLDAALIALPAERTKNGKPHDVPLSPAAVAILSQIPDRKSDYVFGTRGFQNWSTEKRELDARIAAAHGRPLAAWTLHDSRRVVSTAMHERLGIEPHIVEAVLAHTNGHTVARVYNRAKYETQKREALNAWAELVAEIVGGTTIKQEAA